MLRVGGGGGVEDVGRGGVHRLAARDHDIDAEGLEDVSLAGTGGDGNEAEGLLGLRGSGGSLVRGDAGRAIVGLHHHVVDEDLIDLTVLEHVLEHAVGLVGVDVNLEVREGTDDELAITERGEVREGGVGIEALLGLEEELVAVGVLRALPVIVELDGDAGVSGTVRGGGGGDGGLEVDLAGLAEGGVDEGLDEGGEAVGTGVDDAVLLEDGQEVRRAGDGLVRLDDEGLEHLGDRHLLLLAAVGARRHVADDGEDRALDRLADCLEGDLHAVAECRRDVRRSDGLARTDEALRHAAEDLARDDAGVAAGTHEGAVRDRLGNGLHVRVCGKRLDLTDDGAERERHVGAGVAIGHGEDVELVDVFRLVGHSLGGDGEARANHVGNHVWDSLHIDCLSGVGARLRASCDDPR